MRLRASVWALLLALATGPPLLAASGAVFQGPKCGTEKGCFMHPSGCSDGAGDCLAGVSYQWADQDVVQLELFARGTGIYIALGLSTEQLMGRDYVVYCTSSYKAERPGDVGIGYNPAHKQPTVLLDTDYFNPVQSYEARVIDGMTYCRLNISTTIPQVHELTEFRTLNTSYYLMIAAGASSHPDKITYHSFRVVSDQKINVATDRKQAPQSHSIFRPPFPAMANSGLGALVPQLSAADTAFLPGSLDHFKPLYNDFPSSTTTEAAAFRTRPTTTYEPTEPTGYPALYTTTTPTPYRVPLLPPPLHQAPPPAPQGHQRKPVPHLEGLLPQPTIPPPPSPPPPSPAPAPPLASSESPTAPPTTFFPSDFNDLLAALANLGVTGPTTPTPEGPAQMTAYPLPSLPTAKDSPATQPTPQMMPEPHSPGPGFVPPDIVPIQGLPFESFQGIDLDGGPTIAPPPELLDPVYAQTPQTASLSLGFSEPPDFGLGYPPTQPADFQSGYTASQQSFAGAFPDADGEEEFILDTSQLPVDPELGFPQISFTSDGAAQHHPFGQSGWGQSAATQIRLPERPPEEFAWVPVAQGSEEPSQSGVSARPVDAWDVTPSLPTRPSAELDPEETEPLLANQEAELRKENFLVSALLQLLQESVQTDQRRRSR